MFITAKGRSEFLYIYKVTDIGLIELNGDIWRWDSVIKSAHKGDLSYHTWNILTESEMFLESL